LEGLAYGLREGKERLEKRANTPITELRISGGGSQSDAAMQLTADIFGLPAIRPHVYETSGLGAAIDAAVGLKLHPDFAAAVREMTRPGEVFAPNHRTHVMYDELYRRIYLRLYARLKPFYKDIRAIVGR
jgi:sugar (pentulose or hexulose) kinase